MSHEDFLFCKPLPTGTTGEHIFQLLNEFIEENGIDWIKCVGVCADGARAMTSRHSGVVARIREVAPEMNCSIHLEALAVKKLPDDLKSVGLCCELSIKARPRIHICFARLNRLTPLTAMAPFGLFLIVVVPFVVL
ncbi:ZBED5 protein, partial [Atractosteus spatula]|nr:ZBED5 protein [Atractosteus spatula]